MTSCCESIDQQSVSDLVGEIPATCVPLFTLLTVTANHGCRVRRLIAVARDVVLGSAVRLTREPLFQSPINTVAQRYLPAVTAGTGSPLSLVGAFLRKVAD